MAQKHGNTVNFVPTCNHYDACDKMSMAWSLYVHKLPTPDENGNTYYTDALTYGYLDHIVQNMLHPGIGTARIIEMTPKRRAMLDKMRGVTKPVHVPKRHTSTDPPFVYPKQYGTKMHDERSIRIMYCCSCGMDFYDHHDISTRVPIHCPWCDSGHVSETDDVPDDDHVLRTRYAERMYIITDENGDIIKK